MKHFYFLIIFLTGFLSNSRLYAQGAQSNVIDEVIWVVGDDAIFLSDVEKVRNEMQINEQRYSGDPYCFIPEQLAIQKLFLHQAKLDSIDISDSEVYNAVDYQINSLINYFASEEKVEEYFNKSINALREEYRTSAKEQEIIRRVQREIMGKVNVTPSEVRSFYRRIPEDSLPYISTTVEVQILSKAPQVSLTEIDNIKNRLRDYTEQINNGQTTFASLARLYSDDEISAVKGGELGLTGKAMLVPEFAAVAFDLNDTKRISRIAETEYGFHIIQLIEKRGDRINVRHILLRPRVTKEEINDAVQKLDSIRNDIVDAKFTFEEAAFYLSDDKETRNNKGLLVNSANVNNPNPTPRTGTAKFEMSELPPEIAITINTMQVGEISKPFTMISKTNKEIAVIVKLKARIEGHKASLTDDLLALKAMVEDEKRNEILNNWIAKKQKETYIRINDNWKNCDFERDGWVQK